MVLKAVETLLTYLYAPFFQLCLLILVQAEIALH